MYDSRLWGGRKTADLPKRQRIMPWLAGSRMRCRAASRDVAWTRCDNFGSATPPRIDPMRHLTVITTGGTIDKVYFDAKSDYEVGAPQIGEILAQLGVAFEFDVVPVLRKDSLDLTDVDRAAIREAVEQQSHRHILITHGTDSMVETARALAGLSGKTIVLTGALNPARFQGSDAVFNIGCAVGAVQSLGDGVWIAMNGRIWDPDHVRKNRAANRFEEVRG
jgi:L-asparaginase